MRAKLLAVVAILIALSSAPAANAQYSSLRYFHDWTIATPIGDVGYRDVEVIPSGARRQQLELGNYGALRLTRTRMAVGACGLVLAIAADCGAVSFRRGGLRGAR
jgi:hypothetical protein